MKKIVFCALWIIIGSLSGRGVSLYSSLQADDGEVIVLSPSPVLSLGSQPEGEAITSTPGFSLSLPLDTLPKHVLLDILKRCRPYPHELLSPCITNEITEDSIERETRNIERIFQGALSQEQSSSSLARILSLDGGGTRGVVSLYFLQQLEAITGKPTYQLFDHIAATSTGSLIATLLTVPGLGSYGTVQGVADRPFTATEALNAFTTLAPIIFGKKKSYMSNLSTQFDEKPLDNILTALLGEKTLMDSLIPITFTAYSINKHKPRIYSTFKMQENPDKHTMPLRNVILSSTAAPSYFLPSESHDIDGGVSFNNPSLVGSFITWRYMKKDPSQHVLLSLGTGVDKTPTTRQDMGKLYLPQIASKVMEFVFNGTNMAKLTKEFYKRYDAPYFRFQSVLASYLNRVDIVSEGDFEKLIDSARIAFESEESKDKFSRLIPYLTRESRA